jgi:hypothetical protein
MAAGEAEEERLIGRLIIRLSKGKKEPRGSDGFFGNKNSGLLLDSSNNIKWNLHLEMLNLQLGTKLGEAGGGFSR